MKKYCSLSSVVFVLVFIVFIIGVTAFSQEDRNPKSSFRKDQSFRTDDTTTSRRIIRDRSLGMDKLDQEMKQLDVEMQKLDVEMKKLDSELKKLDFSKMKIEIDESMKNVDWEKLKKDIQESVANVEKVKIADIKSQVERVRKEVDMQQLNRRHMPDVEKIRKEVDERIRESRQSMQLADEEIKQVRAFTDALEKDGLIKKSKSHRIEMKSGELIIDGQKQSKEVSDKYKSLYKKENFTIILAEGNDKI